VAAFLSGLMGALKGLGAGGKGGGLFASLNPAAASPGGGAMPSMSDLGDFKFGADMAVQGVRPDGGVGTGAAPAKQPGFLTRMNAVDSATGMSKVDQFGRFGAQLQDIGDGGNRADAYAKTAAGRVSTAKQTLLNSQIDELFGDDPKMRFLLKANPEKATAAIADVYKSRNETRTVAPGASVGNGEGPRWMAPEYGQADGYGYRVDQGGFRWGDQRGPTHSEQETGRHNRRSEELGFGNLGVAQGGLGVSRGNLGVARDRLNFDREKAGAGGGGGAIDNMTPAELLALLRDAR
jgi:hypothetical protein